MGQLSKSVGRLWRGIIRVISFGFIKLAEPLEKSPEMVGMRYEEVIAEKTKVALKLKNSIGAIMAEEEILRARNEALSGEIEELKEERDGAAALSKQKFEQLVARDMTEDEALRDSELKEWQSAFQDAASTLEAKEKNAADLESQADTLKQRADDYIIQAQELSREVAKLRAERHEAEADVRLNKQFDSINEALAGISESGADHKLAELRRDVAQVKGRAKASARIAEVDVTAQRQKLRKAARAKVSSTEFLKAIGAKKAVTPAKPAEESPSKEAPNKAVADKPELAE